ncbi:MAG TPA: hypothetical protein VFP34_16710 [Microlunatus sp.]|nr:hypothetical protein [Microlunatus sp.]
MEAGRQPSASPNLGFEIVWHARRGLLKGQSSVARTVTLTPIRGFADLLVAKAWKARPPASGGLYQLRAITDLDTLAAQDVVMAGLNAAAVQTRPGSWVSRVSRTIVEAERTVARSGWSIESKVLSF